MTPEELASVTLEHLRHIRARVDQIADPILPTERPITMLEIHAQWDDEARVWVATSEDVPGLITEAPSMTALVERLKVIIPELMELNRGITGQAFPFHITGERCAIAEAA